MISASRSTLKYYASLSPQTRVVVKLYADKPCLASTSHLSQTSCHTVTLSHCHNVILSHCPTLTLSQCHTVTLSQCHTSCPTLTLSHCHTVLRSHCHTVLRSHCHTVTPQLYKHSTLISYTHYYITITSFRVYFPLVLTAQKTAKLLKSNAAS